jgi:hypothetical protein
MKFKKQPKRGKNMKSRILVCFGAAMIIFGSSALAGGYKYSRLHGSCKQLFSDFKHGKFEHGAMYSSDGKNAYAFHKNYYYCGYVVDAKLSEAKRMAMEDCTYFKRKKHLKGTCGIFASR